MPIGSAVHRCYIDLRRKGYSEGKAARICQSSTGQALQTGKPPKNKGLKR